MALAEAKVSSDAETEEISVSTTPDLKLSTSMFDRVLLSASMVLFVSVLVLSAVIAPDVTCVST